MFYNLWENVAITQSAYEGDTFQVLWSYAIQIFESFELKNMLKQKSENEEIALHFSTFNRDPEGFKKVANVYKLIFSTDEMKEILSCEHNSLNLLLYTLSWNFNNRRETIDAVFEFVRNFMGLEFMANSWGKCLKIYKDPEVCEILVKYHKEFKV